MIRQFEQFKPDDIVDVEPIPEQWNDDYLLYQICDGDASTRREVLDNWTLKDCWKWLMIRRYDKYAEREHLKK